MKNILKTVKIASVVSLTLPSFALAVAQPGAFDSLTMDGVVRIIENIRDWFSAIVAIVAVFMMLYAAFLFITSSGDADKLTTAKKTLTWAIIGIVVAFLAYGIVELVGSFLNSSPGGSYPV